MKLGELVLWYDSNELSEGAAFEVLLAFSSIPFLLLILYVLSLDGGVLFAMRPWITVFGALGLTAVSWFEAWFNRKPRRVTIQFLDHAIVRSAFRGRWMVPFSRIEVPLSEFWGLKEDGKVIRVMRKGMYDTAFTFKAACFESADDQNEFYELLTRHGAKIIRRQNPAAETAETVVQ